MMSVESHHCSRKLFCAFGVISVLLDEYSEDTRYALDSFSGVLSGLDARLVNQIPVS